MTDVVLDAAAFDHLERPEVRALLRAAARRGGSVRTAAVTLAEVCRGAARTRTVESAIARSRGGRRILVVDTDVRLAKLVGSILHQAGAGSALLADAHVVACCTLAEQAIVLTADPDDLVRLADAVPGTRITVRHPARLD